MTLETRNYSRPTQTCPGSRQPKGEFAVSHRRLRYADSALEVLPHHAAPRSDLPSRQRCICFRDSIRRRRTTISRAVAATSFGVCVGASDDRFCLHWFFGDARFLILKASIFFRDVLHLCLWSFRVYCLVYFYKMPFLKKIFSAIVWNLWIWFLLTLFFKIRSLRAFSSGIVWIYILQSTHSGLHRIKLSPYKSSKYFGHAILSGCSLSPQRRKIFFSVLSLRVTTEDGTPKYLELMQKRVWRGVHQKLFWLRPWKSKNEDSLNLVLRFFGDSNVVLFYEVFLKSILSGILWISVFHLHWPIFSKSVSEKLWDIIFWYSSVFLPYYW